MIRKLSPLTWFAILLALSAILALALPPNPTTLTMLHISPAIYRAAILTLILPYAVIWFSAFYAFDKLHQYAQKLHHTTEEGAAFRHISNGVGVMAWGLSLTTIISLLLNSISAHHPGFNGPRIILNNYIAVLLPLISFTIISKGTRQLTDLVSVRPSRIGTQLFILVYTAVSTFFVYLVIHNYHAPTNPYRLTLVPLVVTLIIPYICAWCIGLLSAYELRIYARRAVGLLYKQAIAQLSAGIAFVIVAAIAVQYLTSVYANRADVSLSTWLILIYCLLALQASGYVLIALGSKRLKRIEEV